MLIASLVEFAFAKLRMRQAHNSHLVNFDMTSSSNANECGNLITETEPRSALLFLYGNLVQVVCPITLTCNRRIRR